MTSKFNLKKSSQSRIYEKMLGDNRTKFDIEANDDTGNLDWLLNDTRKGSPDQIQEGQLHSVMSHDNDQPILEAALDKKENTLNQLRVNEDKTKPLMDYSIESDVEREKDFKKADKIDKKDRNTELWDKFIGVQLTKGKTVITNNVQPSQLLSNYETREEMNKANKSTKTAEVLGALMDADAMIYHIYRTAASESRDQTEQETQQVKDITSCKIRILAKLATEDEMTPAELEDTLRAEKAELASDKLEITEKAKEELEKQRKKK